MDTPPLVFALTFALLIFSTWVGATLRTRAEVASEEKRTDAGLLLSAILTLLFLIIGFSFSMAINRYDLRRNCEQAEAVALGTLHSRADLLAPADTARVRSILRAYLDQRVLFYTVRDPRREAAINAATLKLQSELWTVVRPAIASIPPPLMGLLVTGVNDVVAAQRATQAAWFNRIPLGAWALMAVIAFGSCCLIGYRARKTDWLAFSVVPTAVAVSFFLMSDLDSPRAGVIRVAPVNVASLAQTLSW